LINAVLASHLAPRRSASGVPSDHRDNRLPPLGAGPAAIRQLGFDLTLAVVAARCRSASVSAADAGEQFISGLIIPRRPFVGDILGTKA
jgi:hypothetical protein